MQNPLPVRPGFLAHSQVHGLFLGLLLTLLPSSSGLQAQEISLPLGAHGPAATLETLDGTPVEILDYVENGRPTLLEFWATWCGTCKALEPQVRRVQEEWGDRIDVVAVAVAVSQSREDVQNHAREQGLEHTFLWDGEGEAVQAYDVPGTGIVLILDAQGKVVYNGSGRDQDLVAAANEVLGGR